MKKLSNTQFLSIVSRLLILLLIAKIIALGIWWFLPSNGVNINQSKSYAHKYKRIDFKNMLERSTAVYTQTKQPVKATLSISSFILSGLYGNDKEGFAIVAKKSSQKNTTVVGIGEKFEGYTLSRIKQNSVVFLRDGKEYVLKMQDEQKRSTQVNKVFSKVQRTDSMESRDVKKTDINYYRKNPTKIWNDIAINEVFDSNRHIKGFRVDRVKPNTKIAQLGLQKGDVIIRANNVDLTSYKAVMDIYKDIDNIDTLELIVQRGNQEKEIVYEVR